MRRPTTMPSMSRYLALLDTPRVQFVLIAASVLGIIIGLDTLILHLTTDPLADVHAYYDAGARLNAGLPLYDQPAGTNDADFYRYPPLLAVAFRPLAMLPFETAALIWEGLPARPVRRHDLADRGPQSLDLDRPRLARRTVRVEPRGRPGPGRGHVPRRARLPMGDRLRGPPQDPARARRDLLAGPARLARLRHVRRPGASACSRCRSCSSRRARSRSSGSRTSGRSATSRTARCTRSRRCCGRRSSPASSALALRYAPSRIGWHLAVALSVFANPRLLMYQLSTLLAAVRPPDADAVGDADDLGAGAHDGGGRGPPQLRLTKASRRALSLPRRGATRQDPLEDPMPREPRAPSVTPMWRSGKDASTRVRPTQAISGMSRNGHLGGAVLPAAATGVGEDMEIIGPHRQEEQADQGTTPRAFHQPRRSPRRERTGRGSA